MCKAHDEAAEALRDVEDIALKLRNFMLVLQMAMASEHGGLDLEQCSCIETTIDHVSDLALINLNKVAFAQSTIHRLAGMEASR